MSEVLALLSGLAAMVCIFAFLYMLFDGRFNAFAATLLGIGTFSMLDIPKYYYFSHIERGWIGDETFLEVAFMVWISTLIIAASYRIVMIASNHRARVFRSYWSDVSNKIRRRGQLVAAGTLLVVLVLHASEQQDSYIGLVMGGMVKGLIFALIGFGLLTKNTFVLFCAIAAGVIGIDDSSRRAYIAILVPVISLIALLYKERFGSLKSTHKIAIMFSLVAVFIFLNALRMNHDFGAGYDPDKPLNNIAAYVSTLKSIDTFYNSAFLYQNIPNNRDFYFGETYLSVAVAPIPRAVWEDKPYSLSGQLGLMQSTGFEAFDENSWAALAMISLSTGFVGEAYANFGLLGVLFLSILIGCLAALYDKKIEKLNRKSEILPYCALLSSFALIHRGDFYTAINFQLMMLPTVLLLSRVLWPKKSSIKKQL